MTAFDAQATGCTSRLAIDPATGIADCTTCGFHGRALLHLAYSIARSTGLNPAHAIVYALAQARYLTEAVSTHKPRADVTHDLALTAAAAADRVARIRETAHP